MDGSLAKAAMRNDKQGGVPEARRVSVMTVLNADGVDSKRIDVLEPAPPGHAAVHVAPGGVNSQPLALTGRVVGQSVVPQQHKRRWSLTR